MRDEPLDVEHFPRQNAYAARGQLWALIPASERPHDMSGPSHMAKMSATGLLRDTWRKSEPGRYIRSPFPSPTP